MNAADLHAAGWDIHEIVEELGVTMFEVRAEINRVDPPDRGPAFLLPNTSGLKGANLDGAVLDVRLDPVDNRRPADIVANLVKRGESERRQKRRVAECGTLAGYSRHRRRAQEPCDPCRAAKSDYERDAKRRRATA